MRKLTGGFISLVLVLMFLPATRSPFQPAYVQAVTPSQSQSGWEVVSFPSSVALYALDMIDSTEGWVGGTAGIVFHYDGNEWSGVPTDFKAAINAIDMVNSTLGWGVTASGEMIRCDGSSWQVHSQPATALSDVFMLSATEGWAVGGAAILRYDNASDSWLEVSNPSSYYLKAIDMVNASDGWIVGVGGTFLHWDGSSWQGGSAAPGVVLNDVDMVHSTDGWAVGTDGGTDGAIYHWDGNAWSKVLSPTSQTLVAVSMVDSEDGWIVGERGTLLHYDGDEWDLVSSPTSKYLYGIQMLSAKDGWAAGGFGTLLHYTGAPPDLSTSTKTVNPRQATAGEQLTYTIAVHNSGQKPAPSVVVTDTIPSGTTYVPDSASTNRGTIQGPGPLVVTVGDIEPGGEVTITFQVSVDDLGLDCWFITNEALIGLEGVQLTRKAVTTVGDCYRIFLPLALKGYQ